MSEIELLRHLLQRAQVITFRDDGELDDIIRKGKMALQNLFPTKLYWFEIDQIKLTPTYIGQKSDYELMEYWNAGQVQLFNLLHTAIQDYELQQARQANQPKEIIREKIVTVQDNSAIEELSNQFAKYKRNAKFWILFFVLLLIGSAIIWIFYFTSGWNWYQYHPKKLSIALMIQMTLIVGLLNIPFKRKWLIWIPIISAVLIALFSIL